MEIANLLKSMPDTFRSLPWSLQEQIINKSSNIIKYSPENGEDCREADCPTSCLYDGDQTTCQSFGYHDTWLVSTTRFELTTFGCCVRDVYSAWVGCFTNSANKEWKRHFNTMQFIKYHTGIARFNVKDKPQEEKAKIKSLQNK